MHIVSIFSGKGFHFGLVKLEVKSKTDSGLSLTSGGQSNIDSGRVGANIEIKTKRCPGTGTQLTTKWNTENIINTSLSLQDKLVPGLTLTLDSSHNLDNGNKNGKLKAEFASSAALMSVDSDLNLSGPIINSSAVLGNKVRRRLGMLTDLVTLYRAGWRDYSLPTTPVSPSSSRTTCLWATLCQTLSSTQISMTERYSELQCIRK